MTQTEAIKEIHKRVRECFTRHSFLSYGDALGWWLNEDYETRKLEAGEQGMSSFSTDILWLTSLFGPKGTVDKKMHVRKVPALKPVRVCAEPDDADNIPIDNTSIAVMAPPQKTRKKRRKRRRF